MTDKIYKIVTTSEWNVASESGLFEGSPVDHRDGYIHFSTGKQLDETLNKHFAGQKNLLILTVDSSQFGDELKWEVSRGGDLFPHLYRPLKTTEVERIDEHSWGD